MQSMATINVREEVEGAQFSRFHFNLGLLICGVLVVDGYGLYNAAYAAHFLSAIWHLDQKAIGMMLSSGLLGFAIGSLVQGVIADRYGRRRVLLAGLWLAAGVSVAIGLWADSYMAFCVLRLLLGCALGVLMPLSATYLNEFAPKRSANRYTLWFFSIGWGVGAASAGVVAQQLVPSFGWQALYFVGGAAVLMAIIAQWALPESLDFLVAQHRDDQVPAVLGRVRGERAELYRNARFTGRAAAPIPTRPSELLAPKYRRTSLLLWVCGWLSLFASYGLSGWLPIVMLQRGETLGASLLFGSLLMISNAVSGIGGGYIADAVRSRSKVLAYAWVLGAVVMLMFMLTNAHWLNIVCVAAAGLFIIGPQNLLNNLFAMSYEPRLRATGVGTALGVARIGAIAGPAIAGVIQQEFHSTLPMFALLTVSLAACAAIVTLIGADRPLAGVEEKTQAVPATSS